MYAREEKLAGAEGASNLEDWGYALPENFAIWRHKYGISVAEVQTFLLMKRP